MPFLDILPILVPCPRTDRALLSIQETLWLDELRPVGRQTHRFICAWASWGLHGAWSQPHVRSQSGSALTVLLAPRTCISGSFLPVREDNGNFSKASVEST